MKKAKGNNNKFFIFPPGEKELVKIVQNLTLLCGKFGQFVKNISGLLRGKSLDTRINLLNINTFLILLRGCEKPIILPHQIKRGHKC